MSEKLHELLKELDAANNELTSASARASVANGDESRARNRVNEIQKKIDAELAEMRKTAPRDTEWKRERERVIPIPH